MRKGLICGCYRSGTTILAQMLMEQDGMICTHELGTYFADHPSLDGWMLRKKLSSKELCRDAHLWPPVDWECLPRYDTQSFLKTMELFTPLYIDKYPLYTMDLRYATTYADFVIFCVRHPCEVLESQVSGWREHHSYAATEKDLRTLRPWVRPTIEAAIEEPFSWLDYVEAWERWKAETDLKWFEVPYWEMPRAMDPVVEFLGIDVDRWRETCAQFTRYPFRIRLPESWEKAMQRMNIPLNP